MTTNSVAADTTLLLVAHGTRNRAGNNETDAFADQWRKLHPDWRIDVCFIEHAEILLDAGLDRAAQGARQVLALPLILNAAGHVKMELPAALEHARERHPGVEFRLAPHLGMGPEIRNVLQNQLDGLMKQLAMPDPRTTGVVLLGRGSSDAGANGELAKMARWLYEANDHELVDLAFTGVTWPRLETVVQRQVRLGMTQVCIVPVYLFTGVLMERIQAQVARLQVQYPHIAFAQSPHFGFDPAVFALLDARVDAAATPGGLLECDGCKYRELAEDEHLHDHGHTAVGSDHGHGHARHDGCTHKHG